MFFLLTFSYIVNAVCDKSSKKRTKGLSCFAYLQAADLLLAKTRKMSTFRNRLSFKMLCHFVCEPVIENHLWACH